MEHRLSADDQAFRRSFEACLIAPADFDHAAHVRLTYIYLCEFSVEDAAARVKASLLRFLEHLGVGESKYHETLTRAWVLVIAGCMQESSACISAEEFLAANPQMLDRNTLLAYYSAEVLQSPQARPQFVEPDIRGLGRKNRNVGS